MYCGRVLGRLIMNGVDGPIVGGVRLLVWGSVGPQRTCGLFTRRSSLPARTILCHRLVICNWSKTQSENFVSWRGRTKTRRGPRVSQSGRGQALKCWMCMVSWFATILSISILLVSVFGCFGFVNEYCLTGRIASSCTASSSDFQVLRRLLRTSVGGVADLQARRHSPLPSHRWWLSVRVSGFKFPGERCATPEQRTLFASLRCPTNGP